MTSNGGRFVVDGSGTERAGLHLLVDLWGAVRTNDPDYVSVTIHEAVEACRASLLHFAVHRFEPHGLTAFAMLSESHVAFHSWPERDYAAVDLFTCGNTDAHSALELLRVRFAPRDMHVCEHARGSTAPWTRRAVT